MTTETGPEYLDRMRAERRAEIVTQIDGRDVTHGELDDAFNRVKNPEHWKYPIDATIEIADLHEQRMIAEAVVYFCGCVAEIVRVGRNRYRVTAIGYFAAIGA